MGRDKMFKRRPSWEQGQILPNVNFPMEEFCLFFYLKILSEGL